MSKSINKGVSGLEKPTGIERGSQIGLIGAVTSIILGTVLEFLFSAYITTDIETRSMSIVERLTEILEYSSGILIIFLFIGLPLGFLGASIVDKFYSGDNKWLPGIIGGIIGGIIALFGTYLIAIVLFILLFPM